jgi:hypothetical protein
MTLQTLSLGSATPGSTLTSGTVTVAGNPPTQLGVAPVTRQNIVWAGDPTLGLVGDGVSPDTTALQAAVDLVSKNNANGMLVLTGRYLVTQPITVTGPCAIVGIPLRAHSDPPPGTQPATVVAANNGFTTGTSPNQVPAGVFVISAPWVTIRDLEIEVRDFNIPAPSGSLGVPGASTTAIQVVTGGDHAVIERVRANFTYFGFLVSGEGSCEFRFCNHNTGSLAANGPLPSDPALYLMPTWNGTTGHFGTRYSFKCTNKGFSGMTPPGDCKFFRCNQENPQKPDINYRTVDFIVHGQNYASCLANQCGAAGGYRFKFSTDEGGGSTLAPNFGHSIQCNADHCVSGISVQSGTVEVHTAMLITADPADLGGAPVILKSNNALTALFSNMHIGNTGGGVHIDHSGTSVGTGKVTWTGGTMTSITSEDAFFINCGLPSDDVAITGVVIDGVSGPVSPAVGACIHIASSHQGIAEITGNVFRTAVYGFYCDTNMTAGQYKLAENFFVGGFSTQAFFDKNGDSGTVATINYNRWIHGNHGAFQPVGLIDPTNLGTIPTLDLSAIQPPVRNPFGVDCSVFVTATTGATISGIQVGGAPIAATSLIGPVVVPVRLPSHQTIKVNGSAGTGAVSLETRSAGTFGKAHGNEPSIALRLHGRAFHGALAAGEPRSGSLRVAGVPTPEPRPYFCPPWRRRDCRSQRRVGYRLHASGRATTSTLRWNKLAPRARAGASVFCIIRQHFRSFNERHLGCRQPIVEHGRRSAYRALGRRELDSGPEPSSECEWVSV